MLRSVGKSEKEDIVSLIQAKSDAPLHHEMFREAWHQRLSNPRSSMIMAMASLEIAVKYCIGKLIPNAQWLAENVPSPPVVTIIKDMFPSLPAVCSLPPGAVMLPKHIEEKLKSGVSIRNGLAHAGKFTVQSDSMEEILTSVKDMLWIIDFLCGQRWAYSYIRESTRQAIEANVSVALSEAEVHWRTFLDSLIRRGLKGVKLIICDDHAGLKAARRAALPSVPWQRCQFHLQHNAHAYIPRLDQRKPVALRIRAIFNAPDRAEAERLLKQAIEAWATDMPKLAQWAEDNLPEGFAAFDMPQAHRVRVRTTNGLERINREIRRRTRVASIFPNTASCLRLVSALLAECDEEWMTGKIYLSMVA
jgi:Transposase, Mutator family